MKASRRAVALAAAALAVGGGGTALALGATGSGGSSGTTSPPGSAGGAANPQGHVCPHMRAGAGSAAAPSDFRASGGGGPMPI